MKGIVRTPPGLPWRPVLASMLAVLGLQWPASGQAACTLKVTELPVKMVGRRAIATVGINGTAVPLMVDSGAFFSFLTEATASQLNLHLRPLPYGLEIQGVVGKVDAQMTRVKQLTLGNGDLAGIDFVVGGNEAGEGAMGIIGRNIVSFADTEYDLAHGMIRLVQPSDDCATSDMAYWAREEPVSEVELMPDVTERIPSVRAKLRLNGHQVTALFDTGADTTTVSLDSAHKAGIKDADMVSTGRMYGAGRGKVDSWTAAFDRVELAGEAILHNRLDIGDVDMTDADMLVGADFFLSHHVYVSRQQSRMYFTYNGGPVFALNAHARAPALPASGAAATEALRADAYARRGAASLSRGDLAEALADLDRACALEPGTAALFATRAAVHGARKEGDAALADLDTALRLDPALADARLQRATMRADDEEPDLALQDLSVLDKALPRQSQLRRTMAQTYHQLGMPGQAVGQWNLWIAANPHDIGLEEAYNGRCWARVEQGIELDKALDDCDEAVDADDKNASYLDSRGWAYLRLGKLKKSVADFDRGLAIKPDGAWSLYGRALARQGLGDAVHAQADLAAARAAYPRIDAAIDKAGLPLAAGAKLQADTR